MAPGYGTASVAFAAGPTVVSTFLSHCVTWPTRHSRPRNAESSVEPPTSLETLPGNQLRYDEGLNVIRRFLEFSSRHGVEEVQGFTAQPVPVPRWVRREVVTIPEPLITRAAEILTEHLESYGPEHKGIELIGGGKWWQVRGRELEGEWIEMRKDYEKRMEAKLIKRKSWMGAFRQATGRSGAVKDGSGADVVGDRVILYIHGGAFFFSSLDMHRYQIQRHARKAGARAFVPNYRLSPQYPFPCGLQDSLAAYMYLIDPPPGAHSAIAPENIILMGDSAGGGMCLSLLVVIREMGLPMPAAASLMSPWVDLTHSMPSIVQWDGGDYIPSVGFHYKPSAVWPPIPGDGIKVDIDGKEVTVDDQIQLYCPNNLLTHPLVSPINNGSLGGLCPLYISAGGAELLRDEIIYIAHKAANPTAYPPSEVTLAKYPEQEELIAAYPPTYVELQVFEGACHVATTLAWTRSAKHIFRGAANFNIWAFNDAPKSRSSSGPPSRANSAPGAPQTLALSALTPSLTPNGSAGTTTPPEPAKQLSTASDPTGTAPSNLKITTDNRVLRGSQEIVTSPAPASAASTPGPSSTNLAALAMLRNSSGSGTDGDEPPTTSDEEPGTPITPASGAATPHAHFAKHSLADRILVQGYRPAWGEGHMVAERVSTHGRISPMERAEAIPALDPALRSSIGQVRGHGPIKTWLAKRADWDKRYAKDLKVNRDMRIKDRAQAEKQGFLTRQLQGERPPLASLAGLASPELAERVGKSVDAPTHRESKAVALWAALAEGPDEEAVKRERRSGEERRSVEAKRNDAGRSEHQRRSVDRARQSVDMGRKSIDMGRKSVDMGRKSVDMGRKSFDMGRRSAEGPRPTVIDTGDAGGPRAGVEDVRKSLDGGKSGERQRAEGPEMQAAEKGMAVESTEASTQIKEASAASKEARVETAKREEPTGNTLEDKLKRLEV